MRRIMITSARGDAATTDIIDPKTGESLAKEMHLDRLVFDVTAAEFPVTSLTLRSSATGTMEIVGARVISMSVTVEIDDLGGRVIERVGGKTFRSAALEIDGEPV